MKRFWKWLQSGLGSLMVDSCWQDIACDYHEHTLIGARKEAHLWNDIDILTYALTERVMSKNSCHFNKKISFGSLPEDIENSPAPSWESVTHMILIHLGRKQMYPRAKRSHTVTSLVQHMFSDKRVLVNMLNIKHLSLLLCFILPYKPVLQYRIITLPCDNQANIYLMLTETAKPEKVNTTFVPASFTNFENCFSRKAIALLSFLTAVCPQV